MEQRNPSKWQNDEIKCQPPTTKWTSCSGDQTLKLHCVQTPTLSERGKNLGAEYNTHHRRKAVIYKETWTPEETTQSIPILQRPAFKPHSLSQGKEAKKPRSSVRKPKRSYTKEPRSLVQEPRSSDIKEPRSSVQEPRRSDIKEPRISVQESWSSDIKSHVG